MASSTISSLEALSFLQKFPFCFPFNQPLYRCMNGNLIEFFMHRIHFLIYSISLVWCGSYPSILSFFYLCLYCKAFEPLTFVTNVICQARRTIIFIGHQSGVRQIVDVLSTSSLLRDYSLSCLSHSFINLSYFVQLILDLLRKVIGLVFSLTLFTNMGMYNLVPILPCSRRNTTTVFLN